ncbi:MAG: hypothetical protein Q8920_15880 [Bacillota bacterium]|nr:hypothetical protein [Bacillota bacterium]
MSKSSANKIAALTFIIAAAAFLTIGIIQLLNGKTTMGIVFACLAVVDSICSFISIKNAQTNNDRKEG